MSLPQLQAHHGLEPQPVPHLVYLSVYSEAYTISHVYIAADFTYTVKFLVSEKPDKLNCPGPYCLMASSMGTM